VNRREGAAYLVRLTLGHEPTRAIRKAYCTLPACACGKLSRMSEPNEAEQLTEPRKRLSELIGEEIARQSLEREREAAYADLPETPEPANPGSNFARRVVQKMQQKRFEV